MVDKAEGQARSEAASCLSTCCGGHVSPARADSEPECDCCGGNGVSTAGTRCESSLEEYELDKSGVHLRLEEAGSSSGGEALRERGLIAGGGLPIRLDCSACLCIRRSNAWTAN